MSAILRMALRAAPDFGSASVDQALDLVGGRAHGALGQLEALHVLALPAVLRAHAQDDEARAGHRPDGYGGHRTDPVTRVAHRAELPALELLGREVGQLLKRRLQAH